MMTVAQIMEELGGFTSVAQATGIPLTTVHSWKRVNFVPEWRRPALIALAKKRRKSVTADDFPTQRARKAAA